MPKYKMDLNLGNNDHSCISIIVEAPSKLAAKNWLLTNHGTKTVADIVQIFENKGGVLEDSFEFICDGELIPRVENP